MAAVLPIAALAGAGISALGAIGGGLATGASAGYAAQVAKNNSIIAERNAAAAIGAGGVQSEAISLRSAAAGGQIKAAQAANGISVNSGSAVNVQQSQREVGELDTLTAMNNAAMQAYGYNVQASSFKSQEGLYSAEAAQAPIGGALGATGNLLSNASNIGMKWGGGGSNGVTGYDPSVSGPGGG